MDDKKFLVTYDDSDKPTPKPPTVWDRANTPRVDIRGNNPTTKAATEQFQQDHPVLGGISNALLDTASSMTSPLAVGLGVITGGAGLAEKMGLGSAIKGLHGAMRLGGAGMAAHGAYKVYEGKTPYEKAGGALEAGLGLLGARGGPESPPTGPTDYTTPSGLRVAMDTLRKNPNPVNPGDVGVEARTKRPYNYADFKNMHKAIDAHTLANPKGSIAVNDIWGKGGRPDISVVDPDTKARVPKELPIVEMAAAKRSGLADAAKEMNTANAVEVAKGAPSKAIRDELELKKPFLDLIEASRSRGLSKDEVTKVAQEAATYPKGVVAKALADLRTSRAQAGKVQETAQKASNADAAANIDVKLGQEAKLNEDLKNQAAATKPMDKAQAKATEKANKDLSKGNTPENRDAKNLTDVEAWAKKRSDAKVSQANAEAQQSQIDDFIDRPDVAASQPSASVSVKGKGPNDEAQSLRQSFHVVPPDPKAPAGDGPGGAAPDNPLVDPPATTKGIKGRKNALKVADALGGPDAVDLKFNPKDGLHYVVPKGGSLPETPIMAPSMERDQIALKRFTNRAEAVTMAKHTGGELHQDGPRQYRVKFPEEPAIEQPVDQLPLSTDPTPIQEWSNGGTPPKYSSLGPTQPTEAPTASSFNRGDLSAAEFSRMMNLQPGPNLRFSPAERAEYQALKARSQAPPSNLTADVTDYTQGTTPTLDVEPPDSQEPPPTIGEDSFDPTALDTPAPKQVRGADGKTYTITPGDAAKPSTTKKGRAAKDLSTKRSLPVDTQNITPTRTAELMNKLGGAATPPEPAVTSETAPFVNPQGEAEPTLPGVEPTVNPPVAPVAEAPFSLSGEQAPSTPPAQTPDLFSQSQVQEPPPAIPQTPVQAQAVAPIRLFKSPLEHLNYPNVGYPATQAALKAGELPTSDPFYPTDSRGRQVNPARQQGALKAQLGKPTTPPAPDPVQLEKDAQAAAVQSEINDPATPPLHREMLKRWLDDHGISLFPKDTPGGSIVSSFGAGQGTQFKKALSNLGSGEQSPLDQAGSFLGNLRRNTLLNPYSAAKKGIGDFESLATGALHYPERAGDILKNLFSQNTIDNFKAGWDAPAPSGDGDFGHEAFQNPKNPLGWSGRAMSGMTNATKNVLMDSDFTPEEAQALTLTKTPSRAGTKDLYEFFSKPGTIQNHLNPFSRIAANWLESGYEHSPAGLFDLLDKNLSPEERSMVKRKAAIGTGAGALAYAATPDDFVKEHPVISRMMTAGPVGPMILGGMALKNTTKDGSMPFGKAVGSLIDELPGMQTANDLYSIKDTGLIGPARNYLSSYTNVARPIAEALDPQEKDLYSKDLTDFEKLTNKSIANIPGWRSSLQPKPDKKISFKVTY